MQEAYCRYFQSGDRCKNDKFVNMSTTVTIDCNISSPVTDTKQPWIIRANFLRGMSISSLKIWIISRERNFNAFRIHNKTKRIAKESPV